MSGKTNHRRLKHGFNIHEHASVASNGVKGPASQIPGLSHSADNTPEAMKPGRRVGIFETDSDYVKLAKQGGQKGLLWHEETDLQTKPNAEYKPPDWFSADSKPPEKICQTKKKVRSYMTSEELKKKSSEEALQELDAPFGSDTKSAWESEDSSIASDKEKISPVNEATNQVQKLSLTALNYQEANKFKRKSYDKKPVAVNMSKLLSFAYAEEDRKSPNDDDVSSMTSEPASSIVLEDDLD